MKISVQNISKRYGKSGNIVHALNPCTFDLHTGEQLAIVGTSGSGKSTLLHLLGCLEQPNTGKILFDDENVSEKNDANLSNFRLKNIGFIFQSYNLLPELTAYENILLPSLLAHAKPNSSHLDELIYQLDLQDRLQHLPGELSGGQQQRVAIARALSTQPKILLCDEPTGNLDSVNSQKVIDLLKTTTQEIETMMVIVTHDAAIAKQYHRIITIEDGNVGGDLS